MLKYLARCLTGGPISDLRIIGDKDGRVTCWARSKDKAKGKKNRSRPFSLPGKEFVRRWAMHILPKGYTCSRQFGGYHGRKRAEYIARCRELLGNSLPTPINSATEQPASPRTEPSPPRCPQCDVPMLCVEQRRRPSGNQSVVLLASQITAG